MLKNFFSANISRDDKSERGMSVAVAHCKDELGSVMLEYILINFGFVVAVAGACYFFSSWNGGVSDGVNSYQWGKLGSKFNLHYKTCIELISMPYP